MRTTVEFDSDTAAAIDQLRREKRLGLSEAVNELIRQGLTRQPARPPFVQTTYRLGAKIDISNVAEALEVLEGSEYR